MSIHTRETNKNGRSLGGVSFIYIYPISPSTSFIIVVVTTTIPESSTSRQQPPIPDQSRACFSDSTPTGSYFRFRVFAVFAFFAVFAVFAFSRFSRFRVACPCITGGRDTRFVRTEHEDRSIAFCLDSIRFPSRKIWNEVVLLLSFAFPAHSASVTTHHLDQVLLSVLHLELLSDVHGRLALFLQCPRCLASTGTHATFLPTLAEWVGFAIPLARIWILNWASGLSPARYMSLPTTLRYFVMSSPSSSVR